MEAPGGCSSNHKAALLLLLLFLLYCALLPVNARHAHANAGDDVVITEADYQGLQAIKHDLAHPRGYLRSWNDIGLGGACSGVWTGIKCVNGSVIAISLPWRDLAGRLSACGLGQLVGLWRLSLHDNAIVGQIPPSLGFLPDLRGVYLFNNRFSGTITPVGAGSQPPWLPPQLCTTISLRAVLSSPQEHASSSSLSVRFLSC